MHPLTRLARRLATLPCTLAVACAAPAPTDAIESTALPEVAPPAPAVATIAEPAPIPPARSHGFAPGDALVWSRGDDGAARTHHLAADGAEVDVHDGALVAARGGVWAFETERVTFALTSCDELLRELRAEGGDAVDFVEPAPQPEPTDVLEEPIAEAPPESWLTSARLRRVDGEGVVELVPRADAEEGYGDIQGDVTLVASVGPWLFVREEVSGYACGAHGSTGVTALVWNVDEGGPVPLAALAEGTGDTRALARAELEESVFEGEVDALELTEIVPTYATDGSIVALHRWTGGACYACTQGGWSSYTASTLIEAERVPTRLRPYADATPAVARWAAAHPDAAIGGASVVAR